MIKLTYNVSEIQLPDDKKLESKVTELKELVTEVNETKEGLKKKTESQLPVDSVPKDIKTLKTLVNKVTGTRNTLTQVELHERIQVADTFLYENATKLVSEIKNEYVTYKKEVLELWKLYKEYACLANLDQTYEVSQYLRYSVEKYVSEMTDIGHMLNSNFSPSDRISCFLPDSKIYMDLKGFSDNVDEYIV